MERNPQPIVDVDRASAWVRGLDWVERHLSRFALDPGEPEPEILSLKAMGELARTADLLCRSSQLPPHLREKAATLLRFAWNEFGRGEAFARWLEARPFVVLGTIYSIFEPHGCVHERTRELLARLGAPGGLSARQLPPRREGDEEPLTRYGKDGAVVLCLALGLAWRVMGLASPWSLERLFPRTLLAERPDFTSPTEPDTYSMTHAVFFMTDWGDRPEDLDATCRDHLLRLCPAWMEHFRRRSNLDLYAELALALSCIGARDAGGDLETVLREAQGEDGMIPGPPDRKRSRIEAVEDPARRDFLRHYHTTLVGIMASFAATVGLARRRQPAPASRPAALS